jgi:type I restriction enzyme S subunit
MSTYFGGSIPWVKSGELGDGHVFETEETISELGLKSSNAKLFPKGTLCIALYGATVGKLGILEVDAATNQAVCGLFLPDEVHRDFVFYYLASIRRDLIEQGKGGAQSNISNGLVRQTWIPIAPFNEQRRIVAKIEELFSDLDAGVAALKRAKANLKRYRASVLKAAVEGKLTEEGRAKHPAKEPASALLARILKERRQKWEADQLAKFAAAKKEPPKNWKEKYVEPTPPDTTGLPELPERWCWASVEQTSEVQGGIQKQPKRAPAANSFPFLRVANVHRNRLELDEVHRIELFGNELERLRLETGDLLVVEGNGSKTEIGRSAIWTGEIEDCVHQNHIIRVRFLAGSSRYLNYYWNSPSGNGRVMKQAASTSGLYTLSVTKVCSLPVPLASIGEQELIVAEVEERLSVISTAESEISNSLRRASRLRQSILKQAFEGRLVPQDPKDEPASVLLERLRASRAHDEADGTAATSKRTRAKIKESSGEPRTRIRRGPTSQNQQEE